MMNAKEVRAAEEVKLGEQQMKHVNYNASCRYCIHKEYCYAYSAWDDRAQTCVAYNVEEKKDIVIKK